MAPLPARDPLATRLADAIRAGDTAALDELLAADGSLAATGIIDERGRVRTPLHILTDWPGFLPHGPSAAALLLRHGADPDAAATGPGPHAETPLHWTASNDDVDVARVLIDAGANLEAPGGSIAGTPLANAVGYGCWRVGALLVERGAQVPELWQAAGLGLLARVEELMAGGPSQGQLDEAFWQACHGGHRRVAEFLRGRGAAINATPGYAGGQTALGAVRAPDTARGLLAAWLVGRGARAGDDA